MLVHVLSIGVLISGVVLLNTLHIGTQCKHKAHDYRESTSQDHAIINTTSQYEHEDCLK